MIDRRFFLKSSGLALVGGTLLPNVFVKMANAATTRGNKTLVAIFQRGAVDGLNMIVPYGESAYYAARPTIAVPRPGAEGGAIDLDGFFGLHPSLASLSPYFKDHSLAMIHAVGSPDTTRSHFDAQDFMESGTPGVKSTEDGFLARAVGARKETTPSPLRAVALSPAMPRILSGGAGAVAMTNISQFGIRGGANVSGGFESMYAEAVAGTLGGTAKESFEAARILKSADPQKLQPENGAVYPNGPLANSLRQIAQLIKSNVGLEVAFADVSGWDTHAGEGGAQGQLANNLRNFSDAIAAFARDLGSRMGDVVLVTMSEFGRTVRENGNRGTDHGHANVMLLLGGGVKGGKVHGKWPGLSSQQLYENRDLAITTDFRDVFSELLTKQLAVPSLKSVFPGYDTSAAKWKGLLA
ncbi:MAG TPA: DUF1501 domain-containing protein [Thermoanaerobaculia bacterium]|jgi:uncharacterized protein (DUF1501 family)|nr:DUF1501 domain-containing protein [Thermoanaerobaculia bacterium]